MTNLDKLTEKDGGLRKEQNGVTLGIDKGKNTGITIVKHDPQTVLSVQLDRAETAKLVAYLGGKDLLTDAVKSYESLQNDCVERMEELRGTIRELIDALDSIIKNRDLLISDAGIGLTQDGEMVLDFNSSAGANLLTEINLKRFFVEKARKQLGRMKPKKNLVDCPECDGTGIVISVRIHPKCCGNFSEDGSCCNYPIPDYTPEPQQCEICQATGKVPKN